MLFPRSDQCSGPQSEPTDEQKNKQDSKARSDSVSEPECAPCDMKGLAESPYGPGQHWRFKCDFCGGPHPAYDCALVYHCPHKQALGEDCVVVCVCGTKVIDGKCPNNCGNTWGHALLEKNKPRLFWCPPKMST